MSEQEGESEEEQAEETLEEQEKVWKCEECGEPLPIPPEFSEEQLEELKKEGELEPICVNCRDAKEREEREKRVFKGQLTVRRETWKPLLTAMNRLLEEATFRVNGETITVCEMDQERVAMFRGVIKKESIEDFVEEQPDKTFRVDLPTFINAIKQAGYPCTVKSDGGYLYFENSWGSYRMPLFEEFGEAIPTPKIEYTAHTTVDVSKIFDKLKWIKDKPDGVRLIAKDGNLSCKFGNEIGEQLEAEIGDSKGEGQASYNLEYLKVLKERYSGERWDIDFATEMPLHAQRTKRVGERETVQMDFWLAPRIESDY